MTVYFHMKNGDVLGTEELYIDDSHREDKEDKYIWLNLLAKSDFIFKADMGGETFYFRSENVLYISFSEEEKIEINEDKPEPLELLYNRMTGKK